MKTTRIGGLPGKIFDDANRMKKEKEKKGRASPPSDDLKREWKRHEARQTRTVWMVEKFVPDHCPTCGDKFTTGFDTLSSDGKTRRRYPIGGLYRIAICPKCHAYTAVVSIENHCLKNERTARRLVAKEGFTMAWRHRTDREGERFFLGKGHIVFPLGKGLALLPTEERDETMRRSDPHAAYQSAARRYGKKRPARTSAPLTAGTPSTEY